MRKLILILISLTLSGCSIIKIRETELKNIEATTVKEPGCEFFERNLTVQWQKRTYWCAPNAGKTRIGKTEQTDIATE